MRPQAHIHKRPWAWSSTAVISTTATITNQGHSFLHCDTNEMAAMYSSSYDMMAQSPVK
jgi:hypothetical protein